MQVEAQKISQMLKDMPERNLCAHRVTLLGQGWENKKVVRSGPRPTSFAISGGEVVVVGEGVSFPIFWSKIVAIRPGKKPTPFLKK